MKRRGNPSKLRTSCGETLTETLCALLIIVVVSAGFVTMVSTATKMTIDARNFDKNLYTSVYAVDTGTGSEPGGSTNIQVKLNGGMPSNVEVNYSIQGDFVAYSPEEGSGT